MKLFISWSGDRSKALGNALHEWIPLVLQHVEPWLSEADIQAGERWADAVAKELEACNYGIIALTGENVSSPWVLFEAGALAKYIQSSRVTPLLLDLDIRDLTGPLTQFQAKKADRPGLADLIQSVNKASPQPIPDARAKQLCDALWPEFEKRLTAIPKPTTPAKHARPQSEILEELVAGVRSLESRFRELGEEGPRMGRPRRPRLHPFMIQEFAHMLGEGPGDPIILLLVSSLFRDDAPWLYELGYEAYRAAKFGSPEEASQALRRFQKASELLRHGPMPPEESGVDPRAMHMLFRELDHLVHREVSNESEAVPKPKRKKADKHE